MEATYGDTLHAINCESDFTWWITFMLNKNERLIAAVNNNLSRKPKNYGIGVLSLVQNTYDLDKRYNDTIWRCEMLKEMNNFMLSFDILGEWYDLKKIIEMIKGALNIWCKNGYET